MADILVRSPRYEQVTDALMRSADLRIIVNSVTEYTINKQTDNGNIVFEVGTLLRDFFEHTPNGTDTLNVTLQIDKFNANNQQIGTTITRTHEAFDGYGEFADGINPVLTNNQIAQTNTTLYYPENTAGYVCVNQGDYEFDFTASATSVTYNGTQFNIERICSPKYDSIKCLFVNKFGLLQEIYFFFVSRESLSVKSESFKRNLLNYDSLTYDTLKHQSKTFNVQGKEKITCNTPFVREDYNEVLKELLLSEHVWLEIDGTTYPVRPTTQSLDYKTIVNDKLIQYTLEFEYANDVINIV